MAEDNGPATGHSLQVPLLAQPGSVPPQLQPEGERAVHRAGDQQGLVQVAVDPGGHADQGPACRQGPALSRPPCSPQLPALRPATHPEGGARSSGLSKPQSLPL